LQAAINAAAGVGCVYTVRGTYMMSATLTIPSNSCIYWDNATIASNGFNGDMVSSTNTSNIAFRGKLILNGSAMGIGTVGQGLNLLTVSNFSFDDIEGNGSTNACIQMLGVSHVRGNKVYLQNCGKNNSTSANFFIANNSTTPSTDVTIHQVDISLPSGGGAEDSFYISGTIATPSQRINVVSLDLNGCSDSCLEINFSNVINIGKIIAVAPVNSAVLIRRGDTDVNIDSIACSGTVAYKICLDIANFQVLDPSEQRITIGQVTASNAASDTTNGAAIRISNSITTSSLTNISIGTIVADTSTRGFYCTASTTHNAHISLGTIITHNNLGDGIKFNNCDDVVGSSWISFDNKVGGTGDNGNAINVQGGLTGNIAAVNVFDDRGGGKLQPFGFLADASTSNWLIGVFGCQDTLEVTGCLSNAGAGNNFIRKKDGTDRIRFDAATADFSGALVLSGLNDFGGQSAGKTFEDSNAANCTNGELALSAGWQSTGAATVTAVAGHGQTCSWTITTGTTTAANPTVTDTLTQPLASATTQCWLHVNGGTHTPVIGAGTSDTFRQTTFSATAPAFTYNETPTAGGTTYFVTRMCGP
jgi:hypothetical protein